MTAAQYGRPRTGQRPRPTLLLAACALALGLVAPAVHAQVRDLLGLVQLAKIRDAQYLAAKAQNKADLEQENQALAGLLPNVNASAQAKQEDVKNTLGGLSVKSSNNPKTYVLSLNQALFRPQAWETYQQGKLSTALAGLALRKAEQDLILRVSKAYFDVLAAQDDLQTLLAQKAATAEQLAFARRNFEVGAATVVDQQEAQARFDLILAQELATRNLIETRQLALNTLVGEPAGPLAGLAPESRLKGVEPETPQAWADMALQGNLDIQQARIGQQITKREVSKSRMGHLPTLDLNAQVVDTEQQFFDTRSGQPLQIGVDNRSLTLALNVPLYSGGATQSKVRQQAALLDKSSQQLEQAQRGASQGTQSAFLAVRSGLSQVSALETAVKSSELALKSNKTGYEVGVRINIDVLNAQQQLNATQRDLAKAKYSALNSMLELQAAVGTLTEASVERINQLLLPTPGNP